MDAGSGTKDSSAGGTFSRVTEDQVTELKIASRELKNAVKSLDARITDLTERIESLGGVSDQLIASEVDLAPAEATSDKKVGGESLSSYVIRIEPLRELAMAAMAETALRDLPSVKQVLSVERAENWANFTLEIRSGSDLVEEMKLTMPVYFKVTDSSPGHMSIALAWAWGEPDAQA